MSRIRLLGMFKCIFQMTSLLLLDTSFKVIKREKEEVWKQTENYE